MKFHILNNLCISTEDRPMASFSGNTSKLLVKRESSVSYCFNWDLGTFQSDFKVFQGIRKKKPSVSHCFN